MNKIASIAKDALGASTLSWVRAASGVDPDREAIVDGAVRLTYGDLVACAEAAAKGFIAAGIEKGDAVAIWAPNIHEWVVAALGLQACGAVLTPLNTRYKGREALDILERSKARLLLTVRGFLGHDYPELLSAAIRSSNAIGAAELLRDIVILRGDAREERSWAGFVEAGRDIDDSALVRRERAIGLEDVSDIMFTSGTTGKPKGAVLTYGHMIRGISTIAEILGLTRTDRYLIIPPFFHTFGYRYGFMLALAVGATGILQDALDVQRLLKTIARERVTFLPGPPTLFYSLLDAPNRKAFDLSSLRTTLVGAAVVPQTMVQRLRSELRFETIVTGYGLTETTGIGTIGRRGDDDETISTTSGRPVPGAEVKVVAEDGGELPPGQPGEIWIRGFLVMKGYFDDPQATAASITSDEWIRTGDVGVMDARGYLRVVDRIKDMFIVGGFNAYPAEIEAIMLMHEKIAQVAVVGAPDERLGEIGVAFVKLKPGAEAAEDEIISWCRDAMANYKSPRIVEFVEALPMNASGKVLKTELRERARTLASVQPSAGGP